MIGIGYLELKFLGYISPFLITWGLFMEMTYVWSLLNPSILKKFQGKYYIEDSGKFYLASGVLLQAIGITINNYIYASVSVPYNTDFLYPFQQKKCKLH